jgi:hypothetical protein
MIKNLIKSVLHIVGSDTMLRPDELNITNNKSIAEILDEEKEKTTQNQKENGQTQQGLSTRS